MASQRSQPFPFSPALQESHPIGWETEMGETMMLGLRLTDEGVPEDEFHRRFGVALAARYGSELKELSVLGLIEWTEDRVRLTRPARLVANRVFREFV
jgi:oxygen-independent coproporphyrinogen-3 oxidase